MAETLMQVRDQRLGDQIRETRKPDVKTGGGITWTTIYRNTIQGLDKLRLAGEKDTEPNKTKDSTQYGRRIRLWMDRWEHGRQRGCVRCGGEGFGWVGECAGCAGEVGAAGGAHDRRKRVGVG